jgi:DNA-binding HxlR family transcriptional regulator
MEVLAKPWTGLLIVALEGGPLRFCELRDAVGSIGDRMLSLRLRELEQNRLVRRHVFAGPPVRVEYELTDTGRGFGEVSDAVRRWGAAILRSRAESPIGTENGGAANRRLGAGGSRPAGPKVLKARSA